MSDDEYWFEVENERIEIGGVDYDLENSLHVIADGVEYLVIDGERYELQNNPNYGSYAGVSEEPPGEGISILSSIIQIGIILIIGMVLFKGAVFAFDVMTSDEDISNSIVVEPKAVVDKNDNIIRPKATYPPPSSTKKLPPASQDSDKIVKAMDYTNPTTRDFALMQIDKSHGGNYNIAQICDVWEKINNRWTYVNDPRGFEYFSPASRTINLGLKGDCDDFAILIGSVMQSIGGSPRIVLAKNSHEGGHAYAELMVASSEEGLQNVANYIGKRYHCKSIAYHTDHNSNGDPIYWLNLDWQSRYPGGPFYKNDGETLIVYPNGYVKKYR